MDPKARTVSFLILKYFCLGWKSVKPGCPCLAVALVCTCAVGLAVGGTAVACGTPGHPSGASFGGAEWGVRGKGVEPRSPCTRHALATAAGLRHPGVCPQGGDLPSCRQPQVLLRRERETGRGCWIRSCLVLQVALRVTWLTCVSQFLGNSGSSAQGDQGYFRFPRVSAK